MSDPNFEMHFYDLSIIGGGISGLALSILTEYAVNILPLNPGVYWLPLGFHLPS